MSRRTFLALSAIVIVGCRSQSDDVWSDRRRPEHLDQRAHDRPVDGDHARAADQPDAADDRTDRRNPSPPFWPPTRSRSAWRPATPTAVGRAVDAPRPVRCRPRASRSCWEIEGLDGSPFGGGVARRQIASTGGSVHVVADVSEPVTYRFRVDGYESPEGRTAPIDDRRFESASPPQPASTTKPASTPRTATSPSGRPISSCSSATSSTRARRTRSATAGSAPTREPSRSTWTGYRARYATYLADEQLQASRAACPWLVIWDDHEVENNYAGPAPAGSRGGGRRSPARRAMAYQAWWEHTPTRLPLPDPAAADYPIYRSVDVGDLLTISALDGRQYRSDQVCDATLDVGPPCPGWDDPTRTMLGAEQEAWLGGPLRVDDESLELRRSADRDDRSPVRRHRRDPQLRPVGRVRAGARPSPRRGTAAI